MQNKCNNEERVIYEFKLFEAVERYIRIIYRYTYAVYINSTQLLTGFHIFGL